MSEARFTAQSFEDEAPGVRYHRWTRESDDRRVVTVRLTQAGERRVSAAYAEQNAWSTHLWPELSTAELSTLTDLCRRALGTPRATD